MKIKSSIGIDIDGVITDTGKGLTTILSKINGRQIEHSEILTYDLALWGLPQYTHKKFFNKEFYQNLEPIKNSQEIINCLYEDNYVVLMTARDHYSEVMEDTSDWLIENGFLFDELVQSRNKVGPMKHFKLDYLIDDFHGNCFDLAKEGFNSLLFEQPWNKYISFGNELEHKHIKKVKDWKDVTKYLNQCTEVFK